MSSPVDLPQPPAGVPGTLQFRPMLPDDVEAVVQVENRSYAFPWTSGNFVDCLNAGHQCWVALEAGEVVGHGIVTVAVGESHLLNLCVLRDRQGQGHGRQLLAHLLAQAFTQGARRIFLEVRPSNYSAIALYQSIGFFEIGVRKDYYPSQLGHEDALVYALDLSQYFVGRAL